MSNKQSQKLNIDNVRQKEREKKLLEQKAKEIENQYKVTIGHLNDKFGKSNHNIFEEQLNNQA